MCLLMFQFYETISKRAVASGHIIDVFACSYDQIGFYEMQEIAKRTGGFVVLADDFTGAMFKGSFQKIFTKDDKGVLPMGLNGTIEIQVIIIGDFSFLLGIDIKRG